MSEFMRLALVQAALVVQKVYPYPGVGVVIVHQDHIISKANNGDPGQPHAEIKAIVEAQKGNWPLAESILYTNLEPCSNIGLQSACTTAIIQSGIRECHVAVRDPYHLVKGQGLKALEDAGIKVVYGEYEEEARWQLRAYFSRFCPKCGWPVVD